MLKTQVFPLLYRLAIFLLFGLMLSCNSDNNSATEESYNQTAALTFQLKFAESSKHAMKTQTNRAVTESDICNDYLIEDIVVSVHLTNDNAEVASVERNCGAHGLTVNNVPAGKNLYVVCKGYVKQQVRWQGQLNDIIVDAGQTKNIGNIAMSYTGNDTSPPKVDSTFPAENATGVDLNTSIAIIFNEPLAPSSIPDQAITVLNNNVPVTGSISYNPNTYTISFTPMDGNGLSKETTYTVSLKTQNSNNGTIIDTAGQPFNHDISWQFTTSGGQGDTTTPQIIATSPADGATNVKTRPLIQVIFSESMDSKSLNNNVFKVTSAGGIVSGKIIYNDQTRTLSLTPDSPLNEATVYTGTISTEAKDIAQNALSEPYIWQFGIIGPLHSLTVEKNGNGSGVVTSTSSVIDCGGTCQASLSAGTKINLVATADNISEFAGWSGDYCNGSKEPCSLAIGKNTTITANFYLRPKYTITTSVVPADGSGGSISPGTVSVIKGHNQAFQLQANRWYHLYSLLVDNEPVSPASTYEFENVTENHTIQSEFKLKVTNISNKPEIDFGPKINSNGHVVWTGATTGSRLDVYYYDGRAVMNISKDMPNNCSSPEINKDGHVAWSSHNSSDDYHIYYYNGTTITNISKELPGYNSEHQINSNGHVVWYNRNSSGVYNIYYYNGTTVTNISENLSGRNGAPQINSSGHVVWYNYNSSDRYHIYYYNGTTTTNVSKDLSGNNGEHQINSNGHVVWSNRRNVGDDYHIYYYDGTTVTNISENLPGENLVPQINSNGHVIWRNCNSSNDYHIYYYNGTTVINISENLSSNNRLPQINNKGHVPKIRDCVCAS